MYQRPFGFSPDRGYPYLIFAITFRLADFYCALPVLSWQLEKACAGSPEFVHGPGDPFIDTYAENLLNMAIKLRNGALYRECVAYLACRPLAELEGLEYEDARDQEIAIKAHKLLLERIGHADFCILRLTTLSIDLRNLESIIRIRYGKLILGATASTTLGPYYRAIKREMAGVLSGNGNIVSEARAALDAILGLQLPLRRVFMETELDDRHFILSIEIKDEDLPWNVDATDW